MANSVTVAGQGEMPRHVAIIMDGNGRWATSRGLPRGYGHAMGAEAVLRTTEAAADLRILALTLFAFSADNWKRPSAEVGAIMTLIERYLRLQVTLALARGTRVTIIGRRDRLPSGLRRTIGEAENETKAGSGLRLRIAIDYSSRRAIMEAAFQMIKNGARQNDGFNQALARGSGETEALPDVDLLVRTGGEQRLSDFLLWECAYAEFLFLRKMWPDFTARDLERGLRVFGGRRRRFGALKGAPDSASAAGPVPGLGALHSAPATRSLLGGSGSEGTSLRGPVAV